MNGSPLHATTALLLFATGLQAQDPAWEVFGMAPDVRGDSTSVARLTSQDAHDVYVLVLRAMNESALQRSCLEDSLLPHGRAYEPLDAGDTTRLHAVANTLRLRFPCSERDADRSSGTFTLSRIYRVDSVSVRVFSVYTVVGRLPFAAEDVFLVRCETGRWAVVARRNIMIT